MGTRFVPVLTTWPQTRAIRPDDVLRCPFGLHEEWIDDDSIGSGHCEACGWCITMTPDDASDADSATSPRQGYE